MKTIFVPFLDLKVQYKSIRSEVETAIQHVFDNTTFAGGPFVAQFEKDFASYCNCQHAIAVDSGTSSLWLALLGLGIGAGDEVITVPNTFIATAEAISYTGATPTFVDINKDTYTMDPSLLEAAITSKTKAIIPVHLYGQMADMDPIMEIARAHKLFVIEDACQAHGAKYKGRFAGSIGDAGCFSFYPGKNLGAYGEGGAVTTNNSELAKNIQMLRDHGQSSKYHHDKIGWNARMHGLQGAILSVKLNHLDQWNKARQKNAKLYQQLFGDTGNVILPKQAKYAKHVYHVYAIRVKQREKLLAYLKKQDIHCGIHYPIPVHLTKAYRGLNLKKGSFPVAEQCAEELLSLPMFPELNEVQIQHVVNQVNQFLSQ